MQKNTLIKLVSKLLILLFISYSSTLCLGQNQTYKTTSAEKGHSFSMLKERLKEEGLTYIYPIHTLSALSQKIDKSNSLKAYRQDNTGHYKDIYDVLRNYYSASNQEWYNTVFLPNTAPKLDNFHKGGISVQRSILFKSGFKVHYNSEEYVYIATAYTNELGKTFSESVFFLFKKKGNRYYLLHKHTNQDLKSIIKEEKLVQYMKTISTFTHKAMIVFFEDTSRKRVYKEYGITEKDLKIGERLIDEFKSAKVSRYYNFDRFWFCIDKWKKEGNQEVKQFIFIPK